MVENNAHKISFIVIFGSGLYKNILKKFKRYLKNLDKGGNKKKLHARLRFANITVKDELYIYSLKTKGVGIPNLDITQTDRVNRQNDGAP